MIIEILTAILVIVTAVYVYLTYSAVVEAREARLQSLRPHIVVDFFPLGPSYPIIRLTNAGMAVALDVDLTLTMKRRRHEEGGAGEAFNVKFCWPAMQVGANHQLNPPDPPEGTRREHLDVLLEDYGPLSVVGTCRDILGREHKIDQVIDFSAWWSAIRTRSELRNPAPLSEVAQELQKVTRQLEYLAKIMQRQQVG